MAEQSEAVQIAKKFLTAMEQRDLSVAASLMVTQAAIIFPGGIRYRSLEAMVAAAAGRYRWVRKTIAHIDDLQTADGRAIVYVIGTLSGETNHGLRFDGVRFIDRFEVRDHLIASQQVWNDLAESGVLDQRSEPQ